MKRIELGENSYAELKDSVTFGVLMEAMDIARMDDRVSPAIEKIMEDLMTKVVVDGVEITDDKLVAVKKLDAKKVLPIFRAANEYLTNGLTEEGKDEKKG